MGIINEISRMFVAMGPFSIPIVAIICGTIITILKKDKPKERDPEETRMIQEIYNSLERQEKRIEDLETIMYDAKRKDDLS